MFLTKHARRASQLDYKKESKSCLFLAKLDPLKKNRTNGLVPRRFKIFKRTAE